MCGRYYIDEETIEEAERSFGGTADFARGRTAGESCGENPGTGDSGCGVRRTADTNGVVRRTADANGGFPKTRSFITGGDITPAMEAPYIGSYGGTPALMKCRWGFPGVSQRGLVINARAEGVFQSRLFKNGILHHRIAVPAAHFYEWNTQKEKFTFTRGDGAPLYLAGFTDIFDGGERFVIVTTAANPSMEKVHDRMPLVLEKGQVTDWIFDSTVTADILRQRPVLLEASAEYEQQSLFDL